jgi:hypothetical protein
VKIPVLSFSKGMTDFTLNGDNSFCEIMQNYFIDDDGKPKVRDGLDYLRTMGSVSSHSLAHMIAASDVCFSLYKHNSATDAKIYQSDPSAATTVNHLAVVKAGSTADYMDSNTDSVITNTNYISVAKWLDHVIICGGRNRKPVKTYINASGTWQNLRCLGLPTPKTPSTAPTVTISGGSGSGRTNFSCLLLYVLKVKYAANGKDFIVRSAAYRKRISLTTTSTAGTLSINYNGLQDVLPNTANNEIYGINTSELYLEIYRSTNAQSIPYKVTEYVYSAVPASYAETFTIANIASTDATHQLNEPYYAVGGIVENDQIGDRIVKMQTSAITTNTTDDDVIGPQFVVVNKDIAYLARFEGSEASTKLGRNLKRVRLSKRGTIDAWPEDFYVDVEDEITGMAVVNEVVIVTTPSRTYRIEGEFEDDGTGVVTAKPISDSVGCRFPRSFVNARDGKIIYFASEQGIYMCDGISITEITRYTVKKTISDLAGQVTDIRGIYNVQRNFVEMSFITASAETSRNYIIHDNLIQQDIYPISYFNYYSAIGNSYILAFPVVLRKTISSITRKYVYYVDTSGVVMRPDNTLYQDDLISDATKNIPILHKLRTLDIWLSDSLNPQWLQDVEMIISGDADVALKVYAYIDKRSTAHQLSSVKYDGGGELIGFKRSFKSWASGKGGLIANTVKIEIQNGDIDQTGTNNLAISASTAGGHLGYDYIRTVTRSSGTWTEDAVGSTLTLTGQTNPSMTVIAINTNGDVLTVSDPNRNFCGLASGATGSLTSQAWVLSKIAQSGAIKIERMLISSDDDLDTDQRGYAQTRNG